MQILPALGVPRLSFAKCFGTNVQGNSSNINFPEETTSRGALRAVPNSTPVANLSRGHSLQKRQDNKRFVVLTHSLAQLKKQ